MGSALSPAEVSQKYHGKEEWWIMEHPQHTVTISWPFYLQKTAVTQGQWEKVMENNPSEFQEFGGDLPVERVSWNNALRFIGKLSKIEKNNKYRFPTEAEWEYACRAGTTTDFSFGDDPFELEQYAWYDQNSGQRTHPVGTKKPNPWYLYDMHGNVLEWVEDDWHDNYDGAPLDSSAWVETDKGPVHMIRGGSYRSSARFCRSARRSRPPRKLEGVGFRLAMSVTLENGVSIP